MNWILWNKKAGFHQSAFFIIFSYWTRVFALLLGSVFLLSGYEVTAKPKPVFRMQKEMKQPLSSLMDSVVLLHKTFYYKNQHKTNATVSQMLNQIRELVNISQQVLPLQEKAYIQKLLQSLIFHLEAFQTSNQQHREKYLQAINQKLTYISHIYGMKKYAVFFCPQDRSVWMQAKTPKPLHLSYTPCGTVVGK